MNRRPRASRSPNHMQLYLFSFVNPLSDSPRAYGIPKHSLQDFDQCSIQGKKETQQRGLILGS